MSHIDRISPRRAQRRAGTRFDVSARRDPVSLTCHVSVSDDEKHMKKLVPAPPFASVRVIFRLYLSALQPGSFVHEWWTTQLAGVKRRPT